MAGAVDHDIEYFNFTVGAGEEIVWESMDILLGGEINIIGSWVIRNSTITFNWTSIWNYGYMNVQNSTLIFNMSSFSNLGGYLNLTDNDGNPGTITDRSEMIAVHSELVVTAPHTLNEVNINRSYLEGISFYQGFVHLEDLEMRNCTISQPEWTSSFNNLQISGNGSGMAMDIGVKNIHVDKITINNYQTGLRINNWKQVNDLIIEDCDVGLFTFGNGPGYSNSRFKDNLVNLRVLGNITLVDSQFINGSIDMDRNGLTAIQGCTFTGLERIRNISKGVVRGSIFKECQEPVYEARDVLFIENRFKGNDIAFVGTNECKIYHNSFMDNKRVVSGPPLSTWYEGSLKEGNYYDTYMGSDDGSNGRPENDGIGDTDLPYLSRDEYPLMQDRYWSMPDIPILDATYVGGTDTVRLSWEQTSVNFILQRSSSEDFSQDLVSWSTPDPGLVIQNNPNATLYFRVGSYNLIGSRGWSVPAVVLVNQRPLPPINLKARPVPEGESIMVTWDWQGDDIDRAYLFIRKGIIDLNPRVVYHSENAYVIRELENGVVYTIAMVSVDPSGLLSDLSERVNSTPTDIIPPPPPRNLRAIAKSNESLAIEWDPPLTQDLWGYIIFRKGPDETTFKEITRLSRGVLSFEDMGLQDNTTYEYAMASVDDDGPVSEMSEIASNSTLHFNHRPVFTGNELIIYMLEDEGPISSDILSSFTDPDNDELFFSVIEYFPFKATISDDKLWIMPETHQAGEGYVQISVSDGEEAIPYLIGIIVEPLDDPPQDVFILYPVNGSVLLPGAPVTLEASGYDPDAPQGDYLNVTWTSDIDGILHISTQSTLRAVVELTSGIHIITLEVEDRTGNRVTDEVVVAVSLWGWGEIPWSIDFDPSLEKIPKDSPFIRLKIDNDSPLVLRFDITGTAGTARLDERNILIGPNSEGVVTIILPGTIMLEDGIVIDLQIETQTLNGTWGGSTSVSRTYDIEKSNGSDGGLGALIAAIVIISILALAGVAGYVMYTIKLKKDRGPQM